jgi:activating signal cointegrator complex subunit 2
LRKTIISTTYLCLVGLTEDPKPRLTTLIDQLYSLDAAAKAHKEGPTNVNDSLVAELVTITPILKLVREKIAASELGSGRANSVLSSLESFKKAGGNHKPPRRPKRRIDKGKSRANETSDDDLAGSSNGQIHVHRMSLISQIQDLFPDLGSGFVMKLLDEYNENVEEVISHLLEDSIPPHLKESDRSAEL